MTYVQPVLNVAETETQPRTVIDGSNQERNEP